MLLHNDTFTNLCDNWLKLNVIEREIVLLLVDNSIFTGGYTDLTARLDRKKDHISNVRRAAMSLQKRGLVYIYMKHAHVMDHITLAADWQEKLAYNSYFQVQLRDIKNRKER